MSNEAHRNNRNHRTYDPEHRRVLYQNCNKTREQRKSGLPQRTPGQDGVSGDPE